MPRLTDRMIRSLTPDLGRRVLHWDETQRGLGLVVHPTGRKAFKLVYRHGGRPRWFHVGDASIGIAGARKLAAGTLYQVAEGRDPAGERQADRRAGTFGELAERYREEWSKRRNKSWRQADDLVRRYLLPRWGHVRAKEITRANVRAGSGRSRRQSWQTKRWPPRRRSSRGRSTRRSSRSTPPAASSSNPTDESRAHPVATPNSRPCGRGSTRAFKLILLTGQRPGEIADCGAETSVTASGTCRAHLPRIGRARRTRATIASRCRSRLSR